MKRLWKWIKRIFKCRYCLRYLAGYRYLVNHSSKEFHDLTNEHVNCHLPFIVKREFATKKDVLALMMKDRRFNGCRWCCPEQDTDGNKK